jgi:hypothetical protein
MLADDTEVCHALFFEDPAPYRYRNRKRKRSLSRSKATKPSISHDGSSTAEPREKPTPKKLSRSCREPPESPKPGTKVSLRSSIMEQRQDGNTTAEHVEGPLCETCSTCDCRKLLTLPAVKMINDEPIVGNEPKKQADDESADDYRPRLSSCDASFRSDGFLRGRPLPDRLRITAWSFPSSTAFASPGGDALFSPGHVDGLGSFGGRLDQVVPATPSEKWFITDTTVDDVVPSADPGYNGVVHQAFKDDRRGSACETLPRVNSPRPVDVSRRFSLPEPSAAALPFEPRADHGAEIWDEWQSQTGNDPEP